MNKHLYKPEGQRAEKMLGEVRRWGRPIPIISHLPEGPKSKRRTLLRVGEGVREPDARALLRGTYRGAATWENCSSKD